MILRMPSYCRDFRCIADKCKDNCCIGWEIDVDEKTAEYYNRIPGEFGKKLKENIREENGVSSFILKGERCPFLNGKNLCEIIINTGEEHLCQICTDHPRYYEWFDGIREGGIGLCCEEAARIILSQTSPLSYWDRGIDYEAPDEYDTELYDYLIKCREEIIRFLEDDSLPFVRRIFGLTELSEKIQDSIDCSDYTLPRINSESTLFNPDIKKFLNLLLTLEPMDEGWKPYIETVIKDCDKISPSLFVGADTENYLKNIAVYFIWRYFMKAVFDADVISKINLTVISVTVISYLFEHQRRVKGKLTIEDCSTIAKAYSKEIEYNEDNCEAVQFG